MPDTTRPIEFESNGQRWLVSWHAAGDEPDGRAHGAAGICVVEDGQLVLITADGVTWDHPAGRPEGDETWEQTLRREVSEEACADVLDARLLGFSRGQCIDGHELGLVLVRSIWLARVALRPWEPVFETTARRLVSPMEALSLTPAVYRSIWMQAFGAEGLNFHLTRGI